ncbi:MAG: hypothetical protein K6T83_11865 [Alicyclobacillus sp.]|nr:hypothetical protein [Alicyclobacillus sp.]
MYGNSIPEGNVEYAIGVDPCCGMGFSLSCIEMRSALENRVRASHHSVEQLTALKKELADLADTGFASDELEATMTSFNGMEPWRIGETLAECWLEDNRDCHFPWKNQHDLRSLKASLPGTDLVGMTRYGGEVHFAFGEVKASSDTHAPPRVIYGEKGLVFQVGGLRACKDQRRQLIQNLGIRARNSTWFPMYKEAFRAHLTGKYRYWGILLRDTAPSTSDLEYAVNEFIDGASTETPVEFVALYSELPISEWPEYCCAGGSS